MPLNPNLMYMKNKRVMNVVFTNMFLKVQNILKLLRLIVKKKMKMVRIRINIKIYTYSQNLVKIIEIEII